MLHELLVPLSTLNRWANILVTLGTLINTIKHYLNCMDMKEILPSLSVELQMVVWPKFPPLRAMKVFLLTPVLSLWQYAVSSIGEFEWKTRWVMHHYWDNDLYLPLFFSKSPTLISLVKLLLREFITCSSENWEIGMAPVDLFCFPLFSFLLLILRDTRDILSFVSAEIVLEVVLSNDCYECYNLRGLTRIKRSTVLKVPLA